MKFTRLIRDLGILVLFCIGFFLVTRAINLLGEERQETVQVEFSEARRMADRQITRKDFQSAIGFLTKLTDEDEFNSHAWFIEALTISRASLTDFPEILFPSALPVTTVSPF